jgi:mannonate dehydratase
VRITDAKVIICSPRRNFVTLKLITEDGLYGLDDATLNGRELAVASYLTNHLIPSLIGRDARKTEEIWQYFYKGVLAPQPGEHVCDLLRGHGSVGHQSEKPERGAVSAFRRRIVRCRAGVWAREWGRHRRYGHRGRALLELAYKAIRAQSGIPGLESTYGVGRGQMQHEPPEKGMPPENRWSSEKYLNFVPQLFTRLRKEFGPDVHLLRDAHHRLIPIEAARAGKELEPFHLFWLEDPTPAELQEGSRLIRQHSTTPLAVGEGFNTIYDCH